MIDKRISSDPQEGVAVIRELLGHLQSEQWNECEIFGIHLSMEEAVANAIHHGNARDREKSIRIRLETSSDTFYAKITDEGGGFDPKSIPDPTAEENLERPCGRGLMLMRCYMDDVAYSPSGNSVELYKKRSSASPPDICEPEIPQ
jgi:serine/threonine-protein kinase RsbW